MENEDYFYGEGNMVEEKRPDKPRLIKKILAVMEEINRVAKDGHNDAQDYDYVSDANVIDMIRPAMIEQGLIAIPTHGEPRIETKQYSSGTAFLTILPVTYRLIDTESGEELKTTVIGQGIDTGDKGVYKAATGAEKYFLLKTFMLATGDDPEVASNLDEKAAHSPATQRRPSASTPLSKDSTTGQPDGSANELAEAKKQLDNAIDGLPVCPICNGDMWDNREKRAEQQLAYDTGARKSKPLPAFRCKNKECKGVVWSHEEWLDIKENGG